MTAWNPLRNLFYVPRPTRRGLVFLWLTASVTLAAFNTGENVFYLVLSLLVGVLAVSWWLARVSLSAARQVEFQVPQVPTANKGSETAVTVDCKGRLFGIWCLRVEPVWESKDKRGQPVMTSPIMLLHVPPAGRSRQQIEVTFPFRGLWRLRGFQMRCDFPYGLLGLHRFVPADVEVLVYPELREVGIEIGELFSPGSKRSSNRRGQGAELHNLRFYVHGDDARTIHWKTSARIGELMACDFAREEERRVFLRLHLRASRVRQPGYQGAAEAAISVTASLADRLLRAGFEVGLAVPGFTLPESGTFHQRHEIMSCLALLDLEGCTAPPGSDKNDQDVLVLEISLEERLEGGFVPVVHALGGSSAEWVNPGRAGAKRDSI